VLLGSAVLLAVAFAAYVLALSPAGARSVSIANLATEAKAGERVNVSGLIEDVLVSPSAGTVLVLRDTASAGSAVIVHWANASKSRESLIGFEALVTGTWSGDVITGAEIVVKDLGPRVQP
jgi:hypothetical protein